MRQKTMLKMTCSSLKALSTVLLLSVAMVSGCGYSAEPLHSQDVRTIYVDMAESREFRRGIEFDFTEALRKAIDLHTPYKNAPTREADTVLSAEILEWRESAIGHYFGTALPRESAATLIIRYRWQDMRTGELLRDRPRFLSTVTYVPAVGETDSHARLDVVNKLARAVVSDMETGW